MKVNMSRVDGCKSILYVCVIRKNGEPYAKYHTYTHIPSGEDDDDDDDSSSGCF